MAPDRDLNPTQPDLTVPSPGERLLLMAVRGWAHARVAERRPHVLARHLLGGPRVGALFAAWIQAVEAASRRPVRIACADCGGFSIDEQRLIVACGIAPVSPAIAARLLEPLLLDSGVVVTLSRSLAFALAEEGWPLPARLSEAPDLKPMAAPTLH